jgi:hypothetical protein
MFSFKTGRKGLTTERRRLNPEAVATAARDLNRQPTAEDRRAIRQERRRKRQRIARAHAKDRKAQAHRPPQRLMEVYARFERIREKSEGDAYHLIHFSTSKRAERYRRAVAVIERWEAWK